MAETDFHCRDKSDRGECGYEGLKDCLGADVETLLLLCVKIYIIQVVQLNPFQFYSIELPMKVVGGPFLNFCFIYSKHIGIISETGKQQCQGNGKIVK